MTINLQMPGIHELKPRITVFGVGGAGGNAVNNMIEGGMKGVDFVVGNTDAQALALSRADRIIQMGVQVTEGLGAGSQPEIGRAAAEEEIDQIRDHLNGSHMVFITAGMGGGTGTGAAPVVARAAREMGILTVGVVTKPFFFEGQRRMRVAEAGIQELMAAVDTLIVIPNQNLFRVATEKTTFADAFALADQVLYSGVACITDLMVKEGLINLDFADVRAIMRGMGKAMMGTGEATGEKRATTAAEQAIANPLLDDVSMKGARGLLISISGGRDMTLYEVDEAATRIREEVDQDANIILGATFDESLSGMIRVSVVATGIESLAAAGAAEFGAQTSLTQGLRPRVATTQRETQPLQNNGYSQYSSMQNTATTMPSASSDVRVQSAPAPVTSAYAAPAMTPSYVQQSLAQNYGQQQTAAAQVSQFASDAIARELSSLGSPSQVDLSSASEQSFIPPVADRVMKPVRMPSVEELQIPATVQSPSAATQAHADLMQPQPAEKRRMTLLEKLSKVGFGRSQDDAAVEDKKQPEMEAAPQMQDTRLQPQMNTQAAGYRPAQGQLDPHGRVQVQKSVSEDDSLEIPAFLRRQST